MRNDYVYPIVRFIRFAVLPSTHFTLRMFISIKF